MNILNLKFIVAGAFALASLQAHAFTIDGTEDGSPGIDTTLSGSNPTACDMLGSNPDITCWSANGPYSWGPGTVDADDVEGITGTASQLTEFYKDNVGGAEEGSLAGSYKTTFSNTALDPNDALIEYEGGDFMICGECYALVKDGNAADPAWYLFDISSIWDGKEDINLIDFWEGNFAISHVSLFGTNTVVPEPSIIALLGAGLIGIGLVRRKARI